MTILTDICFYVHMANNNRKPFLKTSCKYFLLQNTVLFSNFRIIIFFFQRSQNETKTPITLFSQNYIHQALCGNIILTLTKLCCRYEKKKKEAMIKQKI